MTTERTAIQFVCFENPLPRFDDLPNWRQSTRTLLTKGMRRSILAKRVAHLGQEPAFDFIARNQWPEEAFARAALVGRIGEAADGPCADHGATFWAGGAVPSRAEFLFEKVVALLIVPDRDTTTLRRTLVDAVSNQQVCLYEDGVTDRQRFDVVAEIYTVRGRGTDIVVQVKAAIGNRIDLAASRIAVYQEILTLPPPPPAL